jgi:hypothetical protein
VHALLVVVSSCLAIYSTAIALCVSLCNSLLYTAIGGKVIVGHIESGDSVIGHQER